MLKGTGNFDSLVSQLLNNPPTMQETWVQSLGGKIPGAGKDYPLQYSGIENSMDCIVHGIAKSQTRLSNFRFTSQVILYDNYYHYCIFKGMIQNKAI